MIRLLTVIAILLFPGLVLQARELEVHIPAPGKSSTHRKVPSLKKSNSSSGQVQTNLYNDRPVIQSPYSKRKRQGTRGRKLYSKQNKQTRGYRLDVGRLKKAVDILREARQKHNERLDAFNLSSKHARLRSKLALANRDARLQRNAALRNALPAGNYQLGRDCYLIYQSKQESRKSAYFTFKLSCKDEVMAGVVAPEFAPPLIRLAAEDDPLLEVLLDAPRGQAVVGRIHLLDVRVQGGRLKWKWQVQELSFANPILNRLFKSEKNLYGYQDLMRRPLKATSLAILLKEVGRLRSQNYYLHNYSLVKDFHEVVPQGARIHFDKHCPLKIIRAARNRQTGMLGLGLKASCFPASTRSMDLLLDLSQLPEGVAQLESGQMIEGRLQMGSFVYTPDQFSLPWDTILSIDHTRVIE